MAKSKGLKNVASMTVDQLQIEYVNSSGKRKNEIVKELQKRGK